MGQRELARTELAECNPLRSARRTACSSLTLALHTTRAYLYAYRLRCMSAGPRHAGAAGAGALDPGQAQGLPGCWAWQGALRHEDLQI